MGKDKKRSAVAMVASLIHTAMARTGTKGAAGNGLTQVSHRMIDAFRFFDRDGDGKISPKELQLTLQSLTKESDGPMGADFSMKEIEQFMKEGDTNKDGSIDYREFIAHFQYHEAETARVAKEKVENERRKAEEAARTAAHKLVAEQQARLEDVARETQAQIDAAEAERVLKYEARRVLPAVFNRPFEQLGLAQEPAARRLGFTPETWPRLSSAASTVVPWEKLDQTQRRLAVILGFDEDQDPATWVLVQIEGENGEGDVRSLGVVTGVRHAQQEVLQEEERKRRELEVITFRKRVFAEAARVGAEKLHNITNIEPQATQQQPMALTDTSQKEEAKVEDDSDESDDDAFVLSEKDEQCVDAIWTWSLAGDTSETLSRRCLERYLLKTAGRQLTDSLYKVMCEKIGFDPDMGMPKSVFVMAFYGPYMEPGMSASAQAAAHYEKLDLANTSHFADDATLDSPVPGAEIFGISKEREAELRQVFACVDVNGDGALSRAELIMRLRKDPDLAELLGLPVRIGAAERSAFEAVFRSMDRDHDTEIDADEFVQFFAQRESDELASGSSYPSETADESSTKLPIIAPNTDEVSVDLVEKDISMQDDSPAAKPAPNVAIISNSSDSDSEEEFSIEALRAKRVQLGIPPQRGP
jgi:Ca2+-binding EF-hand superfamily protein